MKPVLLLAIIALTACAGGPTTGGPCKYSYDTLAATVLQVIPQPGDNGYEILFRNPRDRDTLVYSQTGHGYASRSDIANYGIQPGVQCTLMTQTAHGGACPGSATISLMHYQGSGTGSNNK